MFIGNNTLTLNEATLILAVSEYLNGRVTIGCEISVRSVKPAKDSYGPTQQFTVEVSAVDGKA